MYRSNEVDAKFPKKLKFLFKPSRYKVAHGGRGSGKSWGFARALILAAVKSQERILCAREVQRSIKDSVHRLLSDQIQALQLGGFFDITDTEIRGKNGSLFIFSGLATATAESIKSLEGCTKVWVEESQTVTKRSWDILIPTIRQEGSEIWVTLNPDLDTDDTYTRFILTPPPDSEVVQMNWADNPWFTEVLDKERLHCQRTNLTDYANIWEGQCKHAADGAIYADEIAASQIGGRVCNVPYDPMLKVHVVFDLGWNDSMAISLVQRQASELRVIEYIEDDHKTLDYYSAILKDKRLNWGKLWLPHDGRNKDFKTGKSAQEIMQALGWDVMITPNASIEDGIKLTRMTLPRMYFDKTKADRLVQCIKRYRRSINQQTQEPGAPLHDEFSHGADNLRYICVNAESMTNEDWGGKLQYKQLSCA